MLICVLFCGCSTYYGPALNAAPVPGIISVSPAKTGSASTAIYTSLDGGIVTGTNAHETNTIFRGHLLFVRSGEDTTLNAGVFAYGGSYSVKAVPEYRGEYSYFGPGNEFNSGIHFPVRWIDLGIGMYASEAAEFGDYRAFRKSGDSADAEINNTGEAPILSLYPLIRYRASDRTLVALPYAVGLPGILSPSITIQHDDYAFWSCLIPRYIDEPELSGSYFSVGIGRLMK